MYEAIVKSSVDAVVIANRDGDVVFWNDSAAAMFGYTSDEVLGTYVHDILPAHSLRRKADLSFQKFKKLGTGPLIGGTIQVQGRKKSGASFDVQFGVNVVTVNGELFVFAFLRDVSEVVSLQRKLEQLANVDELTNTLNRRAFMAQAEAAISSARRHHEPFSVLMLDIDFFKKINDQYGHHAGDAALVSFAITVSGALRREDVLGRIGGEEFSIALPKTAADAAVAVAEKVRLKVASSMVRAGDVSFGMTVSIGVTALGDTDSELSSLQKRADKALYEAKDSGRDRVVLG